MRRVALRGIRAHLVRFVLSVLAVTLGVAFVAGTFSLRAMLSSTFSEIVDSSLTGDVYVRGSQPAGSAAPTGGGLGDARNAIPLTLADDVAAADGVALALPGFTGPAVLVGADGTAVSSGQAPSFAQALYLDDPSLRLTGGRPPAGPGEIALATETLAQSGLALEDRTTVVVAGSVRAVVVVGEVDFGAPLAGATIVFLDAGTARDAYAPDGLVQSITVYTDPGVSARALVDQLQPVVAAATGEAVTGDLLRTDVRAAIDDALGFVATFLLVFAGISLFVGAFIIANTFAMSVRQRMREFALLRALGASPAQVFASILIQATVVGVLGSAIGVVAGFGLVTGLREVLDRFGMTLSGRIPLDARTVAVSLVVGTVVSIAAAALPARRAALTPPVEAMRDDVVVTERTLRWRALAGTLLTAAGVAAVLLAMARPVPDGGRLLGAGASAVLVGVLVLAPVIARASLGVLAAAFVVTIRPLGRLARGNVTRNPRRTANTAGALMIGMALVGASSVLAASAQGSTRSIVAEASSADFVLRSALSDVPADAVAAVTRLGEVAAADAVTLGSVVIGSTGDDAQPPTTVVGLDPEAFGRTMTIETTQGSLARLAEGDVAVQQATARDEGWTIGTELALTSSTGSATVRVGAIIDSPAIPAPVVLPAELFDRLVPAAQRAVNLVFVKAAPGADLGELRAGLTRAVAPFVVVSVLDTEEFASELAGQVDQVLGILYALLALSVVIAVLGIVNTLALSVIERTREIALLRAVGLGRLQLAGTVMIESVLTALFGAVVGVGMGVALAATMPTIFADVGLTTLVVPWGTLGWILVLAAVAGVLAAVWPAIRAARLPVLDAVTVD